MTYSLELIMCQGLNSALVCILICVSVSAIQKSKKSKNSLGG